MMGKLSTEQRGRLIDGGVSIRATAVALGCEKDVVMKSISRHRQGERLKNLPRSGRPRVTSALQDASIINKAETESPTFIYVTSI